MIFIKMCHFHLSLIRIAALLLVTGHFYGCGGDGKENRALRDDPAGGSGEREETVLRVEATEFSNADFLMYMKSGIGGGDENLSLESMSRLFDGFVEEKLQLEAARRQNISLSDEEKRHYMATLVSAASPEEISLEQVAGLSDRLFDRLIVEKYASWITQGIEVEERDIREYYDAHKRDFLLPERIKVSQILCETEEEAVAVFHKLEGAADEDFRRTAREVSIGPEAVRGGDMGIYKAGDLPHDMETVIFALEEGKLSQVFESSYGYHIFRVDKKLSSHLQTRDEAAPEIRLKALDLKTKEALRAHLEELKNGLNWASFPENLLFEYQRIDQ